MKANVILIKKWFNEVGIGTHTKHCLNWPDACICGHDQLKILLAELSEQQLCDICGAMHDLTEKCPKEKECQTCGGSGKRTVDCEVCKNRRKCKDGYPSPLCETKPCPDCQKPDTGWSAKSVIAQKMFEEAQKPELCHICKQVITGNKADHVCDIIAGNTVKQDTEAIKAICEDIEKNYTHPLHCTVMPEPQKDKMQEVFDSLQAYHSSNCRKHYSAVSMEACTCGFSLLLNKFVTRWNEQEKQIEQQQKEIERLKEALTGITKLTHQDGLWPACQIAKKALENYNELK